MKRWRFLFIGILVVLIATLAGGYFWLFTGLPSLDSLSERFYTPSIRIVDRSGRLLYESIPSQGGRHIVIPFENIPLALRQAAIATEDRSFYTNPGVDLRGILRAFWINLRGGETLAGGSTITQQVAKNLLLEAGERTQRSLRRKLRESILAWQLSRKLSKDEVLGVYLNQTYYGGMAYGVEAAAQTYFGKPAAELDLAECALIAGIPQSPVAYNPFTNRETAKERQAVVLELMLKDGYITSDEYEMARREPLTYTATPYPMEAPHFVLWVRAQLDGILTADEIYQHGGVIVRTTLDLDWQQAAERAIQRQLEALAKENSGLGHNLHNAALVAIDPGTGEILTMVGSPDYADVENEGAINMALAPRQPGSSIKPLVYATALDPSQPNPWTAATMILDVRTSFVTHEGKAYIPSNYDGLEHGPVLVREALASSLNVPAVITLNHIGLQAMFTTASRLGITTLTNPDEYDLSLALGGGAVRLIDLTAAYGAFANGGYRVSPYAIQEITDSAGNLLFAAEPAPQVRMLDERVAWLISDILSDNEARFIGFGRNSILRLDRPAAVKTGTTTNFHDNWTVGYTPDLVVGVWAGNADYQPMRDVSGVTGAAPIWAQFMRSVLTGTPEREFSRPAGMARVEVCALSGLLPSENCPYRRWEWFIAGTQPTETDNLYRKVVVDTRTGRLANASTPAEQQKSIVVLDLPPQAAPWARSKGITLLSDLTSTSAGHDIGGGGSQSPALTLISPPANALYRFVPSVSGETQRLRLEAVYSGGEASVREVTLWVDGQMVARLSQPPYQAWWPLSIGFHEAWAETIAQDGSHIASERIRFEVKGDSYLFYGHLFHYRY
jgi:1A family penicillin-binding protein